MNVHENSISLPVPLSLCGALCRAQIVINEKVLRTTDVSLMSNLVPENCISKWSVNTEPSVR